MIFVLTHYVSVFVIMSKRVTIVLDDDLVKKLTSIQAKNIVKSKKSISFSSVICDELRNVLK